MAFMDALRKKKPKPPRVHSSGSQYASISLASASLSSPLAQVAGGGNSWQKKAWEFYDVVPEMRLVVSYRSSALSKIKLQIARVTPDGNELQTDDRSLAMLETLFGGICYHSSALSRYAQHLTIVGETYTFVVKGEDGKDEWLIVPADQVNFNRKTLRFTHPITGVDATYNVEDIYNFRLWQPHPHKFWEADSPTRGGISSLDKIMNLDASIRTAAISRIVGAGVWFLPLELNLPTPTVTGSDVTAEDQFKNDIHAAMAAAKRDPNSAAQHSPTIVWGSGDVIDKIKDPIRFWSDLDENAADLRDTEIRRYATGQPLPTEMVTGIGKVNHWTGWQLSEEDLKFDISPLAQTICDALTERVVRPVMGPDFVVQPDFTDLVSRPDRTPEAIELRAAGVISLNEVREAAGYEHVDGGDDIGGMASTNTSDPVRVGSQRTVPAQLDRNQDPAQFAVADLLARDLVYTAGQWLATHSGRSNRAEIEAVDALDRHVTFAADASVLEEAVKRVKPKYEGSVDSVLFGRVVDYVGDIFGGRKRYSRDGLTEWVGRGN